jgi:ABC-2 type transport system permease protein
MTANLRVLLIGGMISYRALFNWIRPTMYATTMLGSPLFQILFFTYLGKSDGASGSAAFFIVGNAVQVSAMSGIYAGTMSIANERQFGTLSPLLATPAGRVCLFVGRSLPVIANGMVVSAFGFGVGVVVLDLHLAASSLPALVLVVLVTVFSCTSLGLLAGSFGLRARDVFFLSNLIYFLMLLFCGVNIPFSALPGWMAAIGHWMPLTHGIEAARQIVAGHSLASVAGLAATEAVIGVVYMTVAFVLFRVLEAEGRRRGSLETY